MAPVYDAREEFAQTTSAEELMGVIRWIENGTAIQRLLVARIDQLKQKETVAARLDYFDTLERMIRKGDFEAAAAFIDEETF